MRSGQAAPTVQRPASSRPPANESEILPEKYDSIAREVLTA